MTNSKVVGRERCPQCASIGGDTSEDNLAIYDDGHSYCYACSYFIGKKDLDLSFTYEHLPWRGITRDTMEFYDVRTKINTEGEPKSIGFRYPNGSFKVRELSSKDFRWEGVSVPALFGMDKFTPGASKYVTITEGELDALSIHQALGGPVVSVQSSVTAGRDCSSARSWLNGYERIYLAFDNDANGRDATAAVARLFDYNKIFHVKFTSRKDANEYLVAGEVQELKNVWWNARKYLPENITSSLEEFKQILKKKVEWGLPYPFKKLTDMTYGIRTGEIVLVTAQEKVGKTEFMHHLLFNLLKETKDDVSIGGLFHEEDKLRTLQSLAGIQLGKPIHLPDCVASEMEKDEALDKVVGRTDRLFLHSHDRSNDPEVIVDTLRFLAASCGCKHIIWDHPGMAVFGSGTDNERVALDTLATKCQLLVRELNFGLMVVSHVNDFGQTRGSRYLGKVCDLRIDLKRDTAALDRISRQTLEVTIPYGRYCSNSGPVGSYLFDPGTQRYTEVANDNSSDDLAYDKAA